MAPAGFDGDAEREVRIVVFFRDGLQAVCGARGDGYGALVAIVIFARVGDGFGVAGPCRGECSLRKRGLWSNLVSRRLSGIAASL